MSEIIGTMTAVEPKTVELYLLIGGALQAETWATASEAGEIVDQWIEEAKAGEYSAEVYELLHGDDCYEWQVNGPEGQDEGCQCAQFSTDHRPVAEYHPTEQ
jgi:hypothetical protein